jgi:hypothetical protein
VKPAFHNKYYNGFTTEVLSAGAPEEIRTPDPQIRSLVLYPAELRALAPETSARSTPSFREMHARLRELWMASPLPSGQVFRASTMGQVLMPQGLCQAKLPGSYRAGTGLFGANTGEFHTVARASLRSSHVPMAWRGDDKRPSGAAGAASVLELHGPIRDGQPEGRPDRTVDQPDFAAVGADQFGCDGKSQTGAAGAG